MSTTQKTHGEEVAKRSLKLARKHVFMAPPLVTETSKKRLRLSPEARFEALFNILLLKLEKPNKRDPRYGNIWLYNHTLFAEDTADYLPRAVSVASIFNYFRTTGALLECIVAWAKKNTTHEDERTKKLAIRILSQYQSVKG